MVAVTLVRTAALTLSCALVPALIAPAKVPASSGSVEKAGYVEGPVRLSITLARKAALEKLRTPPRSFRSGWGSPT